MAADVVIVFAFLEALAADAHRVAEALDASSPDPGPAAAGDARVGAAYDDFLDEWDRHRSRLVAGVTAVAEAFDVVASSFRAVEDDLVAVLERDGGGS